MFQNKLVNIMLMILMTIALLGVVTVLLVRSFSTPEANGANPTIDEIIENSWETEEITTNLNGRGYVQARFRIHVDSKEAREELEKRDFQVNHIIIHELAGQSEQELRTQEGMETLEDNLRRKIDDILEAGTVIRVYMTERVVQ
ncbi:flagellar basal body-associated protein FliL [Aliibacillus thermotolerans]|uniref:Flagellar protein FliL n=1 Tax=Aliibacillus thermotolerans TaxID=1834418 RepID=A0ABW0U635_9BACI|nr:flagellar basal body-associated protein FliL [Aliibacillus thermotolerans]MDA3130606.1 flagellar basal body-associated protein FliL [Aliibacillus thermotolerans]